MPQQGGHQARGVMPVVNQLDPIDPADFSRPRANLPDQLEQYRRVDIHGRAQTRLDHEMQDDEASLRNGQEDRDTQGRAVLGYRKKILYTFKVTHANAQAAMRLHDLGYTEICDGLLNSGQHAMLIDVEKKQLLECRSLLDRQRCPESKGDRVFQRSPQ